MWRAIFWIIPFSFSDVSFSDVLRYLFKFLIELISIGVMEREKITLITKYSIRSDTYRRLEF